jgi:GNAT superfamily N-acetyltransferase
MGPSAEGFGLRLARPAEFQRLRDIDEASGALFAEIGIGPFADDGASDPLLEAAIVLASGDPPVGFACVGIVDDVAHLWQLSVCPSASRRGRGAALVEAVCDWAASKGYAAVTLTTFRDVAWNGPFYARMGFRVFTDLTPGLAAIRDREIRIGHDTLGPRIAMRKDLSPSATP